MTIFPEFATEKYPQLQNVFIDNRVIKLDISPICKGLQNGEYRGFAVTTFHDQYEPTGNCYAKCYSSTDGTAAYQPSVVVRRQL